MENFSIVVHERIKPGRFVATVTHVRLNGDEGFIAMFADNKTHEREDIVFKRRDFAEAFLSLREHMQRDDLVFEPSLGHIGRVSTTLDFLRLHMPICKGDTCRLTSSKPGF